MVTQVQLAYILRKSTEEIELLIKKRGLPCETRGRGVKQFHLVKVIQWLIDIHRNKEAEARNQRNSRTIEELAHLLQVDPPMIKRIVKEKRIMQLDRGHYNLTQFVRSFVSNIRKESKDHHRSLNKRSKHATKTHDVITDQSCLILAKVIPSAGMSQLESLLRAHGFSGADLQTTPTGVADKHNHR